MNNSNKSNDPNVPNDNDPNVPNNPNVRRLYIVVLLLLGSGFSALVYQVLWLRLLGLVFGVTVHAASTVLAAFMAGLAVGSVGAGYVADRLAVPLRWFGVAEILIAVTAFATPAALAALDTVYRDVYVAASGDVTTLTVVRFACSFAVLAVPATLMGATMPLALRAAFGAAAGFGRRAALLYAANTAGAVSGALVTGYVLVGQVGIAVSFGIAAAVNVVVGGTALLWPAARAAAGAVHESGSPGFALGRDARRLVLAVAGVSGFVGLALEILWFRVLVMFLPATTYVFTTILATVLGGIAAGSALATRALRRDRDWLAWLAILQIAIALAAVGSMAAQGWTYSRGWRTGATLQASALSILPAMLVMGAAFPVGLYCWTVGAREAGARAGRRIGQFYLVNLSGAIAGAVAAGFLLIPWLGTRLALTAVAGCSLLAGLVLLAHRLRPRASWLAGTAAAALFVALAALLPDPLQSVLARRYGNERVLWREEGAQATVSVHQGEHRIMYLDGLHQANDSPAMLAVHREIGVLAMALRPGAREALVVGLGGGATAGAVAQFSAATVDIVELVPGVVRAAEWFAHATGNVLQRANVRVRVDDGRNHLLLTPKRYDVITADIIQPFHAGAGNLYSLEYFQLAARALADDGVMLQWIGNRPEAQYKLIARTFLTAFPHATAWANGTLLAGAQRPLMLSRSDYETQLADPAFGDAVRAAGLGTFDDLLRLYAAGPDELRTFIGDGPVLTDDRPMVEFFLALPRDDREIALGGLKGDVTRHVVP